MTKKIVLALALTLGTAAVAAPPAFACGGYAVERPEERAVREAVLARVDDHVREQNAVWVSAVAIDGNRATARLFITGERRHEVHDLTLRHGRDGWRVIRAERAQA